MVILLWFGADNVAAFAQQHDSEAVATASPGRLETNLLPEPLNLFDVSTPGSPPFVLSIHRIRHA